MPFEQFSERGLATLRRAGELARRSGAVNPAHLLAAVLEVSGPLGEMAGVAPTASTQKADGGGGPAPEALAHYDTMARQAIGSAGAWAGRRGTRAGPEDLLVVLVDQHSPSVVAALARMGPDAPRLRPAALRLLGLPGGYGPVALEPLPPAGTTDRLPLGIEDLPPEAWAALEARQGRLPLTRVRRRSDWAAVVINEQRAVVKMAGRQRLSDDVTSSLLHHHLQAVGRLGADAAPDVVLDPPGSPGGGPRLVLKVAWFRWTAQRY